ncbi:MAG TPA: hypothetical protein VGD78_12515 [Chthoniobacterales bacterium]
MEIRDARHIDLDGAWPEDLLGRNSYLDRRDWGPRVRYCAPARCVEEFWQQTAPFLAPFTLFGSGDYHHLTGLWLRQFNRPFTLISFDNHPDWDTRPPFWCCGTWLNQALKLPCLKQVSVWGCANFELNPPHRWFGNQKAVRQGRLALMPWRERFGPSARQKFPGFTAADWREQFAKAAAGLEGRCLYVTIDLDCLLPQDAATDWEQGLFTAEDVAWALKVLRCHTEIIGGDMCGAHSPAVYSRWTQRQNAALDHPRKAFLDPEHARQINLETYRRLWPELTGRA